ncbi:hypothetical protein QP912_09855 [Corynebacterium pseudodiphtheriticum]|uniref:hypothetical protein n=1 Tax=Corynebacterium pseudodiphtheriticum TaxID=37637 RepID=UPI00254A7979|nr:hypothetical protein [Corynebacterium pseudodiphtheriticum]MDK8701080.1 hypothetical protein [Corynebacterium pseudodiphtheriticum]MDK8775707.1 hypothetical protein [Corynebacterium pseudodiphtheriticum]
MSTRLRRELAEVIMDNEFSPKTAAFFRFELGRASFLRPGGLSAFVGLMPLVGVLRLRDNP